jgi:hypothetical protein
MNNYREWVHTASGKLKYLEKTLLSATPSTTNPTDYKQTWASSVRHTTVHNQDDTNTRQQVHLMIK